jgi:hypothetical protein
MQSEMARTHRVQTRYTPALDRAPLQAIDSFNACSGSFENSMKTAAAKPARLTNHQQTCGVLMLSMAPDAQITSPNSRIIFAGETGKLGVSSDAPTPQLHIHLQV